MRKIRLFSNEKKSGLSVRIGSAAAPFEIKLNKNLYDLSVLSEYAHLNNHQDNGLKTVTFHYSRK